MSDCMTFPDTVEEFMEQYKVVDTEGIYMSKGSELVPIFRMKQWFEHKPERKKGKWIFCENETGEGSNTYKCSACGEIQMIISGTPKENGWAYCPHCGAKMDEEDIRDENMG